MNIFEIFTNFSRLPRKFFKFSRNDEARTSLRAKQSNIVQYSKKAFTLAEIMIVLSVIGILTAILLPVAHQITPDENVIKFKKAHNTLYSTVRELVTSDKYYLDGLLAFKSDGTLISGAHESDYTYFCKTFSDLISTKEVNCSTSSNINGRYSALDWNKNGYASSSSSGVANSQAEVLDYFCKENQEIIGAEITAVDGVIYFQTSPKTTFGFVGNADECVFFQAWNGENLNTSDYYYTRSATGCNSSSAAGMFYYVYKTFCIDIDGINKGEDPFGYGIRVDGKILNGTRATEWLNKSIQGDN